MKKIREMITNQNPDEKVELSIVIPIYNEEENLPILYQKLKDVLDTKCTRSYEIIFVNDGSTDRSWEIIKELAEKDPHVVGVNFRRNYGQTAAMSAGFEVARGDIIVTMDGDLQNDPEDIPRLLEKIEEGYDIVSGWRKNRKDAFISRTLPSRIANWLISKVTGVHLHDYGCSLKAYRAEVAKELDFYGEMHRFLPALAKPLGAKVTEIPVKHHPRMYGKSKYGISRTFKVILDLFLVKFLLDYRTKPLRVFGGFGLILMSIGLLLLLYLIVLKFMGHDIGQRPLLLFSILLILTGIILISTGITAELITRTYYESQGKRPYLIKEIVRKPVEDIENKMSEKDKSENQ